MASHILHAAASIIGNHIKPVTMACDNMGVVIHGNNCRRSLKESQSQADLIRCVRQLLARLPFTVTYKHVDAHQDNIKTWASLTLLQQLNVIADQLAKDVLISAIATDNFTSPKFPFESVRITLNDKKVTASIKAALYRAWGTHEARQLLHCRNIVSRCNFDLIYWDGVNNAMMVFPQMFCVWVTKLVSHFSGTNRQLSRIDPTIENVCPCC